MLRIAYTDYWCIVYLYAKLDGVALSITIKRTPAPAAAYSESSFDALLNVFF